VKYTSHAQQAALVGVLRSRGIAPALAEFERLVAARAVPPDLAPWPELRRYTEAPDDGARKRVLESMDWLAREAVLLVVADPQSGASVPEGER
jgi:hypothetical protein